MVPEFATSRQLKMIKRKLEFKMIILIYFHSAKEWNYFLKLSDFSLDIMRELKL